MRPVIAPASQNLRSPGVEPGVHPIAIELDFVQPVGAVSQEFHATETAPINWEITWHTLRLPRSSTAGSLHRPHLVQGSSQAPLAVLPIPGQIFRSDVVRKDAAHFCDRPDPGRSAVKFRN